MHCNICNVAQCNPMEGNEMSCNVMCNAMSCMSCKGKVWGSEIRESLHNGQCLGSGPNLVNGFEVVGSVHKTMRSLLL